ncbi:MAG TPA: AmmeMemoRadiSam system protein B [Patescibacteria group bacterium]|nr:AmmeMemoRadiSam system protein B [Patescibacteria group bacterium]
MKKEPAGFREPAVAGRFYPGEASALRDQVQRCLAWKPDPPTTPATSGAADPERVVAVVVPHAGYDYSGGVAGAVYAATTLPRLLVILCPNHTGLGRPVAMMNRGVWRTPLGDAVVDEELADRILQTSSLVELDDRAHRDEHSLEVQLPFLQVRMEEFTFVPLCVGGLGLPALIRLGHDLSRAIRDSDRPTGLVISSDMSHYIPAGEARRKDMMAVERIAALDPEGLHQVVETMDISMCGIAPAVAGLTAAHDAGARHARLVAYANSGDSSGDYEKVVGYAGLAIPCQA